MSDMLPTTSPLPDVWAAPKRRQPPDWKTILGTAVRRLPIELWEERMLFIRACDVRLKEITNGAFPATLRRNKRTHPIFTLKTGDPLRSVACPCSSVTTKGALYIEAGCQLEVSERETSRRTYVLDRFRFNVPRDKTFLAGLGFFGIVPESCLKREER